MWVTQLFSHATAIADPKMLTIAHIFFLLQPGSATLLLANFDFYFEFQ